MANGQNITIEQLEEFVRRADERLDKLELGKADKATPVSITIPATGWVSDGGAGCPYCCDIAAKGVTEKDRAAITIAPGSISTVIACGLCPTCETLAGKIRIRAASVPTAAIEAECWIENGKNE